MRLPRPQLGQGWSRVAGLALVAAVVLALYAPALAVKGLVATHAGGDSPFLLQRVYEMSADLAAHNVPPRWMGTSAYGLGYPFWVYYAPLAYLVAGVINLAGGGMVGAIKVTGLLTFGVAAAGMYLLAWTEWRRQAAAVVAAVAYTAAPYHMVNVYVRGDALGELAGYALLPWLLLAVDRTARRHGGAIMLAVTVALVLLAHNIVALMSLPVAAAYALWRLWPLARPAGAGQAAGAPAGAPTAPAAARSTPPAGPIGQVLAGRGGWSLVPVMVARAMLWLEHRTWGRRPVRGRRAALLLLGVTLGAALAAWFWAPAVFGAGLVQVQSNLTGYFDYHGHFVQLDRLVQPSLAFDYTIDQSHVPWKAGLVQVAVAALGAAAGLSMARRRGPTVFWLAVAVVATWLMTELSRPLWEAVPLLGYVQFPWRWLSVQALALAMLSAPLGMIRPGRVLGAAACLALAVAVLVALHVETLGVRDVSAADIQAFELFSGNLGSTVRAEYLPADVVPPPVSSADVVLGHYAPPRAVEANDAVDEATLVRRTPASQTWRLQVSGDGEVPVAFATLAYSGWTGVALPQAALSDPLLEGSPGVPQPVGAVPGSGWLTVDLVPGVQEVQVSLGRDTLRAVSEAVSLLALGVLAAAVLADRRRRMARALLWTAAAAVVLVAAARVMPRAAGTGPRALDLARAQWPRYHDGGVGFATSRLVKANYGAGTVNAGQDLRLQLGWDNASAAYTTEVALVTPAEPVFGVPDVRARALQIQTDPMALRLAVPEDAPTGAYFLRVRVLGAKDQAVPPRSSEGYGLGTLYLGPVHVEGHGDYRTRPQHPVSRMGEIVLQAVTAADAGNWLEVTMDWEADRLQVHDYKTSVRLLDDAGDVLAQDDKMPVYGYLPTTSWPAGQMVRDRRWIPLADDTPSGSTYRVEVVLYDERSGERIGQAQVGGITVRQGG